MELSRAISTLLMELSRAIFTLSMLLLCYFQQLDAIVRKNYRSHPSKITTLIASFCLFLIREKKKTSQRLINDVSIGPKPKAQLKQSPILSQKRFHGKYGAESFPNHLIFLI
jgi:hypothetical protein